MSAGNYFILFYFIGGGDENVMKCGHITCLNPENVDK